MATPHSFPELTRAAEHMRAGERDAAGRLLKAYLANHPRDAEAWWLMSQIVTRPENVRACLERVVRLRPDSPRARERLARLVSFDEPDDSFFEIRPATPPAPFDPTADLGEPFDPFAGIESPSDPFTALRGQQPGTGNQPDWGPGLGFISERAPAKPERAPRQVGLSRRTIGVIAGVCVVIVLVAALLVAAKQRGWLGGLPDMRALDGGSFTLEYPEGWGAACRPDGSGTLVCGIANDPRYNMLDLYTGQEVDFTQQFSSLARGLLAYEDPPDVSVSIIAMDIPSSVAAYQPTSQAQSLYQLLTEYDASFGGDHAIDYDARQQTIGGRDAWVYRLDVQDTSDVLNVFITGGQGDWAVYDVYIPHAGGALWMTVEAMTFHSREEIPHDVIEHIIASIKLRSG